MCRNRNIGQFYNISVTSGIRPITVIAVHYTQDEIFWLGYQCKKCGLRFESITGMQGHAKIHRSKRICSICKLIKTVQKHHLRYDSKDKNKFIVNVCSPCHANWHAVNTPNWGKKGCTNFMYV